MSCGVGRRCGSDSALLWLWSGPAAVALIGPLAWELFFFFCLFAFPRAASAAYGGSQARGLIGAVAAGLHHNHSNAGSEPHLRPTPQLTAMPDP